MERCIKYNDKIVCGNLKKAAITTLVLGDNSVEYAISISFHDAPDLFTNYVEDSYYEDLQDILTQIFTNISINIDTVYPPYKEYTRLNT